MATQTGPRCCDCIAEGVKNFRPAARGAARERCQTHHRAFRKAQRLRSAQKRVERVYGLSSDLYEALWDGQGRVCAICQKPIRSKRPTVDHDHVTGEVRGLLHANCNYELIGKHSWETLLRAAKYVLSPPAFDIIGRVVVPTDAKQVEGWIADE